MKCRMCGCTEEMACIDLSTGLPCRWRTDDPTVCSCCDPIGGLGMAIRSWPLPEGGGNTPAEEAMAEAFDVLEFDDAVHEEVTRLGALRADLELVIDADVRRGIARLQTERDAHRRMDTWQGLDLVELGYSRGGYWDVRRKS